VCPCIDGSRMSDFCIVASCITARRLRVRSPCAVSARPAVLCAIEISPRLPDCRTKGHLPLSLRSSWSLLLRAHVTPAASSPRRTLRDGFIKPRDGDRLAKEGEEITVK